MEWYHITNEADIPSPALLVYPERIRENIRRMIAIAGGPQRLRPHVKTHKLPQVVQMQLAAGIRRFKCATLSEARMLADTGAEDVLVAYPLYGPAWQQLGQLIQSFPKTVFSALIDHAEQLREAERAAQAQGQPLGVFLDLDVGMERTGIKPGPQAQAICQSIADSPWLQLRGLHLYDGHLRQSSRAEREAACQQAFLPVQALQQRLGGAGILVDELVCGGSPTFPLHAQYPERTLSPGTTLLWDDTYSQGLPDMDFLHAAVAFTRVVSKPGQGKICLDLGHKAIAAEMPHPRAAIFGIPVYEATVHSEEHLVLATPAAEAFSPGDCLYAIPRHICPTMALHDGVWVVEGHRAVARWPVVARGREVLQLQSQA
jgi:D-serine deaminase-like pyridoxal phosphate-dependent protein